MSLRMVGTGGMAFVLAMSMLLSGVIVRSPRTHDHIAAQLRADYARTPLDSVEEMDLSAVLADLPEFSFPEPPYPIAALALAPVSAPEGDSISADGSNGEADGEEDGTTTEPQVQQVVLRQGEFQFDLDRVEIKVGIPVELTVVNEGDQVHGIWIPDLAILQDIRSGKTKVFNFTPEKTGRFRFTCSYNLCGTEEEHARMKGLIIAK